MQTDGFSNKACDEIKCDEEENKIVHKNVDVEAGHQRNSNKYWENF